MSLLNRLLKALGLQPSAQRTYGLDAHNPYSLHWLEEQDHRIDQDYAAELVDLARRQQVAQAQALDIWQTLSRREQQVAILVCQNYTTEEIAGHLAIKAATVRAHIKNILSKFDLHSRVELRILLSDFTFPESPPAQAKKNHTLQPPVKKSRPNPPPYSNYPE